MPGSNDVVTFKLFMIIFYPLFLRSMEALLELRRNRFVKNAHRSANNGAAVQIGIIRFLSKLKVTRNAV